MIQEGSYFFTPRVNIEKYEKGWEGYRTLILGIFHVCILDCPYRKDCFQDTSKYDTNCPPYKGKGEYYRLSNSNEIEIESFLEEPAKYPTYSSVTKFLLKTNLHVPEEEKREFWEHIAFTNFIQTIQGSYNTMFYNESPDLFDNNLPAFVKVLYELKPEVIYVIDTAVTDCLKKHLKDIPGLAFIDEYQDWTLPVYRFTYNIESKGSPEELFGTFKSISKLKKAIASEKILDCIIHIRNREKLSPKMEQLRKELLPHIWDSNLISYLYRLYLDNQLTTKQMDLLKKCLKGLYIKEYTESPDALVFRESCELKQYQKDGIIVELISELKIADKDVKIVPYIFVNALGGQCSGNEEWRTKRKKEYTEHEGTNNYIKNLVKDLVK